MRVSLLLATLLALSSCGKPRTQPSYDASVEAAASLDAAIPAAAPMPDKGRVLYERYCALCHGARGEGYAADQAPALANEEFLATASDELIERAIAGGRARTTMSAWSVARGGPLLDEDVKLLVRHIRKWQTRPPSPPEPRAASGNATRGAAVYAKDCASCHGKKGEDGKYVALASPQLLASASDAYLGAAIERGRPGTPMPAFSERLGKAEVDDVIAALRSWQRPEGGPVELPPAPGALKSVVLNPKGPEPAFDPKADFVSVDAVKRELDRGARIVIADARAPSDYVEMHVAGAVSVPFYRVDAYAPQIPKDRYVIAYCACPHAESVLARDEFRRLGYPRVAVLDEGMNVWRDRGFPTRGGAKP